MQLGQPEAFRVFHQHHRGIGHIHTDLYHGGGHQNVDFPTQKAQHDLFLFLRLQLSVQTLDAHLRRKEPPQPGGRIRHVLQLQRIISLNHGADHIGLPAGPQLPVDEAAGLLPVRRRDHRILNGQPVRRTLRQPRYPAVCIEKLRQCARNRRGGHAQHVRHASLFRQGLPLSDAEAVLLIRDHKTQTMILHALLKKRMCSHDQSRPSVHYGPTAFPSLRCRKRSCQQHCLIGKCIGAQQCLQLLIMLYRQDLRWGHQRGLTAVHGHLQHGQHGNDGLSGAHIALQQPVHHPAGGHILPDLRQCRPLSLRQREGKRLHDSFQRRLPRGHKVGALRLPLISRQHAQRKQQKLVKAQPLPRPPEILHGPGEMHGFYRVHHGRKATLFPEQGRQKILLQKNSAEIR